MTHLNFFNRSSQDDEQQPIYFIASSDCDPREGKILARPGIAPVGVDVDGRFAQFTFSYKPLTDAAPASAAPAADDEAVLLVQFANYSDETLYFATSTNCEPSKFEIAPMRVGPGVRVLSDKPGIVVSNQPITDADAPAGAGA